MKKIEAIAVDIDGTITDSRRRLCASAMEAIRKAEEKGVPTIIVTGNVVNYAYATCVLLGATGGLIAENGGIIFKEGLNNDEIEILTEKKYVKAAEKHINNRLDPKYNRAYSTDNRYRETEVVYYNLLPKEEIINLLEDFEYIKEIEIYDSGFAIHITDKRVNKGLALKELCKKTSINIENVMAVGDSENDKDFLKEAGLKIAVGNAEEELKSISDYVCNAKYGDGVKEAIEKYVL